MNTWSFRRILTVSFILFVLAFTVNAQNLLTNPDAETGNTQGWVDPDDAWSADNVITPHGGAYFFWPARKDIPYTEMYQDVDVSSYSSNIDANSAWLQLSGWLANWDQYPHDRSTLAIEALSSTGDQLLYLSRSHRSPVWTFYQIEAQIPPATRTLRVHLIATRFVGSDNDGYFDDLSLTVSTTSPSIYVTVSSENDLTELPVDSTLQLKAQTIGGTDEGYTWSSSFEAVATVDSNGLVTAHKAGSFTIQATGKTTGKTGYVTLTAYDPNYIIFRAPQSGIEWKTGSLQEVKWEVKGAIGSGTLYFSLNGGTDWAEIATIDTIANGHYFWLVPDSNKTFNECYLKMTWSDGESVSPSFTITPNLTGIEETVYQLQPDDIELLTNYPNPFNPKTTIHYRIKDFKGAAAHVRLDVYDNLGRHVAELVNGFQPSGNYYVDFSSGSLSSGLYFYRLRVGEHAQIQKMILKK